MRKLLLLLIKYIPIIQLVGMLFNNTIYNFDINTQLTYILDFIIGNSIINTILLITCSYIFKFCKWHRIIIFTNLFNLIIANIDCIIGLDISDNCLLSLYYIISAIGVSIATYIHIKNK